LYTEIETRFNSMNAAGFPRGIESIELWNRFPRPWKSIEFSQNVHKVLKKCRNSIRYVMVLKN